MRRGARPVLASLVALALGALLWPQERPVHAENSFGVVPGGQRALFELLAALGLPAERSYAAPPRLDPQAVVWWIEPGDVCSDAPSGAAPPASGAGAGAEREPPAWDARAWLSEGGTALVFLPTRPRIETDAGASRQVAQSSCEWIAGFRLPPRSADAETDAEAEPVEVAPQDEASSEEGQGLVERWWSGELAAPAALATEPQRLDGDLVPRARVLEAPRLRRFAAPAAEGWQVRARLEGLPFVLERPVRKGRLVVIADGRFLSNRWLDAGDAAPFALDLVRGYGVPRIDEYAHGLRAEQRTLVYLAASPALPVFAGLALLGLLALWLGSALPPRSVVELDPLAPTLERFIDSLAGLYARTRDHDRVAQRYRKFCLARLRRHFGLPPETPEALLLERLRRNGRGSEAAVAALAGAGLGAVRSAAALRAAAQRLDTLVEEICS